jgi:predicted secreted hydrolase
MKTVTIPYRQENHGDFDAEWPVHRKISGWWYITGYFSEPSQPERLFSYQFTVIKPWLYSISPYILQLALTNIQTGKHNFLQKVVFWNKDIYVNETTVNYLSLARLERRQSEMVVTAKTDQFEFNLSLNKGKGAFWHGDDGVLAMGAPDKSVERTVYYSYTNMPTKGEVIPHTSEGENKRMQVSGKSWFDRQWGPYHLIDPYTHWEWFSIRFFDDEEVMLFAFPQCPYFDGTFIDKHGKRELVRNYTYTPQRFVEVNGISFSHGWELVMPGVKEEKYELRPLIEGQLNLAYFELLAEVINPKGEKVGLCVVELLPGARNPKMKMGLDLFRNV